ncbi:SDR family NAD(P)-dependent oxidoreductase [Nesterenkonia sp. CL21]|uniref:SDR family NAD(P)-dependent oxidoreductase n=1 Tax=Nesterenkonia sp. CL21 TaxID=3064894 RepID=UPI00287AE093|nr:SDR family NAD(P)-dependent oxidoreductase [Nesterenkonia sp. CL21]MDS2172391.1 SDR family NAD(P)-dependent oxidoreductase [Nesterenkonia sp. CL21]
MTVMIVGASRGLGRALLDGLAQQGHEVIGVARTPRTHETAANSDIRWIRADLADPRKAARVIAEQTPASLETVIYNVGIWERTAFTDAYRFIDQDEGEIESMIATNITGALLVLRRLLPILLDNAQPRVILTGSTSGLSRSGRPEAAFGASKFALNGIADALREGHRNERLAVTTLQLGYLNTEDSLDSPLEHASRRSDGQLVPVHDIVRLMQTILALSPSSFLREVTLAAIRDERF